MITGNAVGADYARRRTKVGCFHMNETTLQDAHWQSTGRMRVRVTRAHTQKWG